LRFGPGGGKRFGNLPVGHVWQMSEHSEREHRDQATAMAVFNKEVSQSKTKVHSHFTASGEHEEMLPSWEFRPVCVAKLTRNSHFYSHSGISRTARMRGMADFIGDR
jgi:hypothetical protein